MEDIDEFDLAKGGVYFHNSDEFYKHENIPRTSISDRINNLGLRMRIPTAPPPPPRSASNPIPPLPQAQPQAYNPPQAQPSNQTTTNRYLNYDTIMQPVYRTYIVDDFPSRYRKLYDWAYGYIPTYYTYEQRKHVEHLLENLIKRELNANKPDYELESMLRRAIKEYSDKSSANDTNKEEKSPLIVTVNQKTTKPKGTPKSKRSPTKSKSKRSPTKSKSKRSPTKSKSKRSPTKSKSKRSPTKSKKNN
ncbi:MAG: hypothetical protein ACRCZI_05920 [Cetobacterium sp.]